ncbi:MAG TPA: GNAT family N-acetyltransferase, partial [Methylomirabilota bacterium]|nr:GNAT family N-acetyltransferase [Methylomirabilota bacterium]
MTAPLDIVVRDAAPGDLPAILAIYNDAVRTTAAIWNDTPADLAGRRAWFDERRAAGFPVLVAVA